LPFLFFLEYSCFVKIIIENLLEYAGKCQKIKNGDDEKEILADLLGNPEAKEFLTPYEEASKFFRVVKKIFLIPSKLEYLELGTNYSCFYGDYMFQEDASLYYMIFDLLKHFLIGCSFALFNQYPIVVLVALALASFLSIFILIRHSIFEDKLI